MASTTKNTFNTYAAILKRGLQDGEHVVTETNESSTRPVVTFKRGADGKWYFNVRAANGEIVAQSEGYERLPSAMHGYDALRALVAGAPLTNLNSFTVDNNDGS